MSQTTETSRGITLPCPCCGEAEASISLHLDDATTFTCRSCENEFTSDDVRDFIAKWTRILAWVDTMPQQE